MLHSWNTLNHAMAALDLTEVERLLAIELAGRKRSYIVKRLHQRITRLRRDHDRAQLMATCS